MKPLPNKGARILSLVQADPSLSYSDIARGFGVSRQRVCNVARAAGIKRQPNRARHDWADRHPVVLTDAELQTLTLAEIIRLLESGRIAPGYGRGTPEQRRESSQMIAAWLRSQLPGLTA